MYLIKYLIDNRISYDITNKDKTECLSLEVDSIEKALYYYNKNGLTSTTLIFGDLYDKIVINYNILLEFHHNQSFEDIKKDYPELLI